MVVHTTAAAAKGYRQKVIITFGLFADRRSGSEPWDRARDDIGRNERPRDHEPDGFKDLPTVMSIGIPYDQNRGMSRYWRGVRIYTERVWWTETHDRK